MKTCYCCKHKLETEGVDFANESYLVRYKKSGKVDTVFNKWCLNCKTLLYGECKPWDEGKRFGDAGEL